jgi:hypothetical protein
MSLESAIITALWIGGFVWIVTLIHVGKLKFIDLWRDSPWYTLGLCAIMGFQVGDILMQAWYWVPAAYIPDPVMVERIKQVECHSPRCEGIVNDLLARAGAK